MTGGTCSGSLHILPGRSGPLLRLAGLREDPCSAGEPGPGQTRRGPLLLPVHQALARPALVGPPQKGKKIPVEPPSAPKPLEHLRLESLLSWKRHGCRIEPEARAIRCRLLVSGPWNCRGQSLAECVFAKFAWHLFGTKSLFRLGFRAKGNEPWNSCSAYTNDE